MSKRIVICTALVLALLLTPGELNARWMRPDTGRFWTMDSFEGNPSKPLSLHKYLYADGNPVNRVDPSGQFTMTVNEMLAVAAITYIGFSLAYQPVATNYRQQRRPFPPALLDPDSLPGIRTQREPASGPVPDPKKTPPGVNIIPEEEEDCPTLRISKTASPIPNIAKHIEDAQRAGHPGRRPRPLHRGDGTRTFRVRNRDAALSGLPKAASGLSWDEYPFASTVEGGAGSSTRVVPKAEQDEQGGILIGFFTTHGVPPFGGCFYVVITP